MSDLQPIFFGGYGLSAHAFLFGPMQIGGFTPLDERGDRRTDGMLRTRGRSRARAAANDSAMEFRLNLPTNFREPHLTKTRPNK